MIQLQPVGFEICCGGPTSQGHDCESVDVLSIFTHFTLGGSPLDLGRCQHDPVPRLFPSKVTAQESRGNRPPATGKPPKQGTRRSKRHLMPPRKRREIPFFGRFARRSWKPSNRRHGSVRGCHLRAYVWRPRGRRKEGDVSGVGPHVNGTQGTHGDCPRGFGSLLNQWRRFLILARHPVYAYGSS